MYWYAQCSNIYTAKYVYFRYSVEQHNNVPTTVQCTGIVGRLTTRKRPTLLLFAPLGVLLQLASLGVCWLFVIFRRLSFVVVCFCWILRQLDIGVSQKNPPYIFWHFFLNGSGFLVQILHAYSTFLCTLGYKFLFNYLQLWRSCAILSDHHYMLKMSTIGWNACWVVALNMA